MSKYQLHKPILSGSHKEEEQTDIL